MSPAILRRYRAERMLRRDFQALGDRVLGTVTGRLRAAGASLDRSDLEACYAQAWQGLYAATLDGEEIDNAHAWLALVTYRRAIEELRTRRDRDAQLDGDPAPHEPALEGAIDDRERLRQLLEGMRARLDVREREAAALCYLQGYSRSEAAARMGISETRMRKVMEGSGRDDRGVSQKVGAIVETIRQGAFCEQQASLMRALAFGVLDPDGERHRLAIIHHRRCPACRRYVASLRRAAAILPPVLTLPGHAGAAAGLAGLGHGAAGLSGSHAGAGPGSPAGALGTSAAAGGGGAAGGSWLLGGTGLGAKLAAGCLLALGVGTGCVTLQKPGTVPRGHRIEHARRARPLRPEARASSAGLVRLPAATAPLSGGGERASSTGARTARARAAQEFGPEQPARATSARAASASASAARGSAASASSGGEFGAPAGAPAHAASPARSTAAAQREFSPG